MSRRAIGLYALIGKAASIRDSSTWLQSITARISGTARKDGILAESCQ